jgi:ribosomal protein S12 methylthiotransferase
MAIQQTISAELLSQMVGTTQRVVIDREEAEYYVGRTQYDSPEVDCEVLIKKSVIGDWESENKMLKTGYYYDVTITKSEDFDLYAEIK